MMIMSPTLRLEAVCLCLLPLTPAHCLSHVLLSEAPLRDGKEDSVLTDNQFADMKIRVHVYISKNMADPPKPSPVKFNLSVP